MKLNLAVRLVLYTSFDSNPFRNYHFSVLKPLIFLQLNNETSSLNTVLYVPVLFALFW
jgi:hypothetical protein